MTVSNLLTPISSSIDYYLSGKHASSLKTYKRGEKLIHKDSKGTEAYVVVSGRVEIYHDDNDKHNVLEVCEKGSILGELSLLTGKKSIGKRNRDGRNIRFSNHSPNGTR